MHQARSALIVLTLLILGTITSLVSAQGSKDTFGSLPDFTQQSAPETTSFGDSRDVVTVDVTLMRDMLVAGGVPPPDPPPRL